jgi:hypothetical protein
MAFVNGERRPNWTVIVQTDPMSNWLGTAYLFFDGEDNADDAYRNPEKYVMNSRGAIAKRPYYESTDRQHLPAII